MMDQEIHEVAYPFSFDRNKKKDGFNPWTPGCTFESMSEYHGEWFADGVGRMVLTVISRHKPGDKHQERIFYLRTWVTPDGEKFGNKKLRITAVSNFTKLIKGFRYKYEVVGN